MLRIREFRVIISKSSGDPSTASPVAGEIWIYTALKVETDLCKIRNKACRCPKLVVTVEILVMTIDIHNSVEYKKNSSSWFQTLKNIPSMSFFIQYM